MRINMQFIKKFLNRRTLIFIIPILILMEASLYFYLKTHKFALALKNEKENYDKFSKESGQVRDKYVGIQTEFAKLKEDYDVLKKTHEAVSLDRDNLIIQVKKRFADSARIPELEAAVENLKKENASLDDDLKANSGKNAELEEKVKELETVRQQLGKERDALKEALDAEKNKSGTKILEQENAAWRKENTDTKQRLDSAQQEIVSLKKQESAGILQARQEVKKLNEDVVKLKELIEQLKEKEKDLNAKLADALRKNKMFEQKVATAPTKFTELARQNKVLIRDTANMHYNMGVFYLKQKEYNRAAREFEQAVELAPDDAASHFNLGYIYAEYLVNRAKAVEHFRKYLQFAKANDKDVDWVKKYLITWQAWEGKEAME